MFAAVRTNASAWALLGFSSSEDAIKHSETHSDGPYPTTFIFRTARGAALRPAGARTDTYVPSMSACGDKGKILWDGITSSSTTKTI